MVSDTLIQAPMTQLWTKYTKSLRSSTGFSKWVEARITKQYVTRRVVVSTARESQVVWGQEGGSAI